MRELGIYGGASGVWVDTARTRPLAPPHGVAVAVLHTGRHYPDELSEDALLYHYPSTERSAGRDRAEIEATKECARLGLPLFVITESGPSGTRRGVRQAWVEDWDDSAAEFLMSFEPMALRPANPQKQDETPFLPFEDDNGGTQVVKTRPNQPRFRFQVLRRYGANCAMCGVSALELLKAAHLIPANKLGSYDPRNGLPLCGNHHDSLDRGLVAIDPTTTRLIVEGDYTAAELGITRTSLSHLPAQPHSEALQWLWARRPT